MSEFHVNVHVVEGIDGSRWVCLLKRVAEKVMASEAPSPEIRLNVLLAGDELVRDLNDRYRGLDESTDVLSFSPTHQGAYYGENGSSLEMKYGEHIEFVLPPGEENLLGDIVISYPQAERQAENSGHSLGRELAILLTHGILHLLGHDHECLDERIVMEKVEAKVLRQVCP